MQWGWNHNPDPVNWSLSQHSGYLRLTTGKVVSSFPEARNTLTQRPFAHYDQSIPTLGIIKMVTDHMKDGDIAGLAVFQDPYAFIAVKQDKDSQYLIMVNDGETIASVPLKEKTVYLRTIASNSSRIATFEYSYDNETFYALGNELEMRFSLKIFTGNKFCLFNYATAETGGFVDFDWFRMDYGN
jgi:beta-xylosidase